MKTSIYKYFLFCILLLALIGNVYATDYYVSTNGSDNNSGTDTQPFKTIAKGLNVIKSGDILYIRAGTYYENLDNMPSGTSWQNSVTIRAYPGETVILKPNSGTNVVSCSSGQYIIVDGLILDAANVNGGSAVWLKYSSTHHIRIINCELKNAPLCGILSSYDADYIEFINLNVHDNGTRDLDHGIYISGSFCLVDNCTVYRNTGWGIHIYSNYGCTNNIVRNCKSFDNATLVQRGVGIGLYSGENHVAYNNIVWGNKKGISVRYGANKANIYNNTIYDNDEGIYIESSDVTVVNNIIYSNGTTISGGSVRDHNLINTDPKFVDAANGNFQLREDSPAIDAGTSISLFNKDILDNNRPSGSAWDIGAHEFAGSSSSNFDADINANPISGDAPLKVQFNGIAAGGNSPYNFHWDFGDGNSSDQQNSTYTYQQNGSFNVTLTIIDNDNKQAIASVAIQVNAVYVEVTPSLVDIKLTNIRRSRSISEITRSEWYDLYVYVHDSQGWQNINYVDVWFCHESNKNGSISNRGGEFNPVNNYVLSYSISTDKIWTKENNGWIDATGKLSLYVDDDNYEYVIDSQNEWAKAKIKLLDNAQEGNWQINAYTIDQEGNVSDLFTKNISVKLNENRAPTAEITLNSLSQIKNDSILVTLTTSANVTNVPTPLILNESDNTTTIITLTSFLSTNIFTGILILDDNVCDGKGYFSLKSDALIDENGNTGNKIISGAFIEINRSPPSNPKGLKVTKE